MAGKAPFPLSASRISPHVVVGVAGMDDERQLGLARRRDVPEERRPLRLAGRVVVVVVEPGLADRHHLRIGGEPDQVFRRDVRLFGGVVRMRADRAEDVAGSARRSPGAAESAPPASRCVTMVSTPAARARSRTASRSSSKSGKSRWQWLSTSIRTRLSLSPPRLLGVLDIAREDRRRRRQRRSRLQPSGRRRGSRSSARPARRRAGRAASPPSPASPAGPGSPTCRITSAVT